MYTQRKGKRYLLKLTIRMGLFVWMWNKRVWQICVVYVRVRESSVKRTLRKRTPFGIKILYLRSATSGCKWKRGKEKGKVYIFINTKERSLTHVFGKANWGNSSDTTTETDLSIAVRDVPIVVDISWEINMYFQICHIETIWHDLSKFSRDFQTHMFHIHFRRNCHVILFESFG